MLQVVEQFREMTATHEIQKHLILPHGSYLINLGSPDGDQREKSVDALVDDLKRCDQLGISLYNIHPGSSCGKISREECISNIAQVISTNHSSVSIVINQSQLSIIWFQPITAQYLLLSTNHSSVSIVINQSQLSIYCYQPITARYLLLSTNHSSVFCSRVSTQLTR